MGIAWAQHRTHELSPFSVKDYQRGIHVLVVVFVKEGQLLLAMRGIVGRVNVQDNHSWGFSKGSHILFLDLTYELP
jgi:hypothetical protein